jgi:hypothetical protein
MAPARAKAISLPSAQRPCAATGFWTSKAISLPSGDHAGLVSFSPLLDVRRRLPPPSAFIVQRSSGLNPRTKTIRFPLGEYAGS